MEGLSRKQKKKLQRRLSKDLQLSQQRQQQGGSQQLQHNHQHYHVHHQHVILEHRPLSPIEHHHESLSRRSSESAGNEWQQVRGGPTGDRVLYAADASSFKSGFPEVKTDTDNRFGLLNSSQHDDQTPVKTHVTRALNRNTTNNSYGSRGSSTASSGVSRENSASNSPTASGATVRRRALFNGHATTPEEESELSGSVSSMTRSNTPDYGKRDSAGDRGRHKGQHSKAKHMRSKSTSPPRKADLAKKKDQLKKFDPESVDWINRQ